MKRFFALFTALVLTCGILSLCGCSSCNGTAAEAIARADAALLENPYKVVLKLEYESDNEEINDVLSSMNVEVPTVIDGDKMIRDMSLDAEDYTVDIKITVVDKVLYYSVVSLDESIKLKAEMNDEQHGELVGENKAELVVGSGDFEELTLEKKSGKKHIYCNKINENGIQKLNDAMAMVTEDIDGELSVSEVDCYIVIDGGKYEYMGVTCSYAMIVDGESYTVTMRMSASLYYDVTPITAPADADEYEVVDYEDIMG